MCTPGGRALAAGSDWGAFYMMFPQPACSVLSPLSLSCAEMTTRIRPKQFSSVFQEGACHVKTPRLQNISLWGLPWWSRG